MKGDKPAREIKFWGSLGALLALALCFSLAQPRWNQAQAPAVNVAAPLATPAPQEDALDRFRREREQVRALEIEQLTRLAQDLAADEAVRAQANRQMLDLTRFMEQEVTLEGVLRAQGLQDVLLTVHQDSCNVLVRGISVTKAQSAMILDAVVRETGLSGGSVKVIPVS